MFISDGLRLGHVILSNVDGRSYCDARFEYTVTGSGASSIRGGYSEFTIGCREKCLKRDRKVYYKTTTNGGKR